MYKGALCQISQLQTPTISLYSTYISIGIDIMKNMPPYHCVTRLLVAILALVFAATVSSLPTNVVPNINNGLVASLHRRQRPPPPATLPAVCDNNTISKRPLGLTTTYSEASCDNLAGSTARFKSILMISGAHNPDDPNKATFTCKFSLSACSGT